MVTTKTSAAGNALDALVAPVDLRTRGWAEPPWIGEAAPSLSWRLEARRNGVTQVAYELEIAHDALFSKGRRSSGEIVCASSIAPWPAEPLKSRDVRWARVRARTELGWTAWSSPLLIEAALLEQRDWRAHPISPVANVAKVEMGPAALLRRSFELHKAIAQARLYVTALGVHETWLNGVRVGDALLAPGWSAYKGRLLFDAYDVTGMLRSGSNVLAAALGDGWWRGNLGWQERRAVYGDTTALIAQLEVTYADGSRFMIVSDENWKGGQGAIRAADIYDGCRIDLREDQPQWREPEFDDSHWDGVQIVDAMHQPELRSAPPVRVVKRIALSPVRKEPGVLAIDTGQNLAGYLSIRARGTIGSKLIVRHAEVLDSEGALFTAPLRNAKATDEYLLAGDASSELRPAFTFHGFRYADIQHDPDVEVEAVEAHVVASDLREIGAFSCSNDAINKLFENVCWSQRANFLSLPTDCPQRDERMGWTGDIQVFASTACANADAQTFLASWLKDLALEQRADGAVPSTVPNVLAGFEFEYGGAAWGDAATLTPWQIYLAYGDAGVLKAQFSSMRAWVDYAASRRNDQGVWTGDFQFGDWLDPAAPPDQPGNGLTDRDYVASAYLALSAGVVAKAAAVLGQASLARRYNEFSRKVADATWRRWRDHALTTQTGCAIALMFGIAPSGETEEIGEVLAGLVDRADGRIGTGFVGTPLVLPALTKAGQYESAYRLLLNEKRPGWLYQIRRGATTTWERWDAIGDDGQIYCGDMASGASMTSFNHYAYGAVAAWLYQSVAGIAAAEEGPGYRLVRFAPQPGGALTWARASIETPLGRSAIAWSVQADGSLALELEIAPAARGLFASPRGWRAPAQSAFSSGRHVFVLQPDATQLDTCPSS